MTLFTTEIAFILVATVDSFLFDLLEFGFRETGLQRCLVVGQQETAEIAVCAQRILNLLQLEALLLLGVLDLEKALGYAHSVD